jgi:chromosome segregation ATPase
VSAAEKVQWHVPLPADHPSWKSLMSGSEATATGTSKGHSLEQRIAILERELEEARDEAARPRSSIESLGQRIRSHQVRKRSNLQGRAEHWRFPGRDELENIWKN